MEAIIAAISIPVTILNTLGGIIGGLWLIVTGNWTLVLGALISTLVSTWILGFLLMPTLIFAKPLMWASEHKKRSLVVLLGAISSVWTYSLILIYNVSSFNYILSNHQDGAVLPYLLLAYAVATGPWTYMASQESRSGDVGWGTTLPVYSACVAAIAMMITVIVLGVPSTLALAITCFIPLAIAWLLQIFVVSSTLKTWSEEYPNESST